MQHNDLIIELVNEWRDKAEEDYALIRYLISDNTSYFSAITFHAQQAVEKFLKAFLVFHQKEFPKTHDIDRLLDIIQSIDELLATHLRPTGTLSPYGVDVRYPGDFPDVHENDARNAIRLVELTEIAICSKLDALR